MRTCLIFISKVIGYACEKFNYKRCNPISGIDVFDIVMWSW